MLKISLFILIFAIWFILSGSSANFYLISGVCSSFVALIIVEKLFLETIIKQQTYSILYSIKYVFWLMFEIFKSTQNIIKIIWQPNLKISPSFGFVSTELSDKLAKIIYANSITLTPGTLTMKLDANRLVVHSLTNSGFEELSEGKMESQLVKLIKSKNGE